MVEIEEIEKILKGEERSELSPEEKREVLNDIVSRSIRDKLEEIKKRIEERGYEIEELEESDLPPELKEKWEEIKKMNNMFEYDDLLEIWRGIK